MSAAPNTTEAVTTALQALVDATSVGEFNDRQLRDLFVSTTIAADRKALAEQGYVICRIVHLYTNKSPVPVPPEASDIAHGGESMLKFLIGLGLPIELHA